MILPGVNTLVLQVTSHVDIKCVSKTRLALPPIKDHHQEKKKKKSKILAVTVQLLTESVAELALENKTSLGPKAHLSYKS